MAIAIFLGSTTGLLRSLRLDEALQERQSAAHIAHAFVAALPLQGDMAVEADLPQGADKRREVHRTLSQRCLLRLARGCQSGIDMVEANARGWQEAGYSNESVELMDAIVRWLRENMVRDAAEMRGSSNGDNEG